MQKGSMLQKEELIQQLSDLVAMPTITGDQATNAQAIEYIISLLSPRADIQRIQNGSAEILIAGNRKSLTPTVGYMVHVDVVAASSALFTMRQKDDLVFGRGVSDMKFSIPLGIALLNELLETKSPLSFSLVVTTDEEIGGFDGAAHLAQTIGWRPQLLIVPDGGDNLRFVSASKGVAQFLVRSTGVSAHASRVWQGKSAIAPLARLVTELDNRYSANNAAESWNTTVNYGQILGGISTNQVCDKAELKLDFRYPETDSLQRIAQELEEITKEYRDQLEITTLSTGLPTATNPELSIVKQFIASFQETYGQKIAVERTYGASDARHFAEYDIPILMIKPVGGDIHMESEWLDLSSTMLFYQALRSFLRVLEKENRE